MSNSTINEVTCPICGDHLFDDEYIDKKMYVCRHKKENGFYCSHILAFCKTCNKLYDQNDFGQHGDVWECKECGSICWPLTDKKRKEAEAKAAFRAMTSKFDDTFGKMGF